MLKNYLCPKCLKSFDKKSNFIRHMNRQKPCSLDKKLKILQDNNETKLKKYISKKFPRLSEDVVSTLIGENINTNGEKKFVCDYCNKSFQSSSYFKKHISELCSRHLRFEQHIIHDRIRRIDKLKAENLELKEKIYHVLKTLPRYCIEDGKVINIEKNYKHFYEQKNTRVFGNEIIDHITDKFMKKMIINPEIGIVNLVRIIHFNLEIPQNMNMFVKSRKFNLVEVYKKSGWQTMTRKDLFHNIITSKKEIMDTYFERFKENKDIKEKYIEKYDNFSELLDDYICYQVFSIETDSKFKKAKNIYDKICKMINLLFLNNQKIEITFTPEQNIQVSTDEVKNLIKPPQKNIENNDFEGFELYCEQNINNEQIHQPEIIDKLINDTKNEVIQMIKENNLDDDVEFINQIDFLNDNIKISVEKIDEDYTD